MNVIANHNVFGKPNTRKEWIVERDVSFGVVSAKLNQCFRQTRHFPQDAHSGDPVIGFKNDDKTRSTLIKIKIDFFEF